MYGILEVEEAAVDLDAVPAAESLRVSQQNLVQPWAVGDVFHALFTQITVNPAGLPELATKTASMSRPGKEKIMDMARRMEQLIEERNCRTEGIGRVKRSIFDEAFNEIVRQITLELPERGVLLFQIKQHIDHTFSHYDQLCAESGHFLGDELLVQEEELRRLSGERLRLQERETELKNRALHLSNELENLENLHASVNAQNEKQLATELEFLHAQNDLFESFCRKKSELGDLIELKKHLEKNANKL